MPLHLAVLYGKLNVVRILIGYGADVNAFGGPVRDLTDNFTVFTFYTSS